MCSLLTFAIVGVRFRSSDPFGKARFGLEYARKNGFKIAVYCPFVVLYIKRHREYLDLLNTKFQKPDRFDD